MADVSFDEKKDQDVLSELEDDVVKLNSLTADVERYTERLAKAIERRDKKAALIERSLLRQIPSLAGVLESGLKRLDVGKGAEKFKRLRTNRSAPKE